MRVVLDSGRYLYMAISVIKRRDLGGYKEIITCKSCSYMDPKYSHYDISGGYKYFSFSIEKGGFASENRKP